MKKYKFKSTLILLLLLIGIGKNAFGQDFYKEYKSYFLSRVTTHNRGRTEAINLSIDKSIKRIHQTLDEFKRKHGRSFFSSDTLYIVRFLDLEPTQVIIWTRKESCKYSYTPYMMGKYESYKNFKIVTDASDILKKFPQTFKQWVSTADTLNFSSHVADDKILNSSAVSFTRAIKMGNNWKFVSASSINIDL